MSQELPLPDGLDLVEDQYRLWLEDPGAVDPAWQRYFARLSLEPAADGAPLRDRALRVHDHKQTSVLQLINAYRFNGHRRARLDPLGIAERPGAPDLDLDYHGLTEADLDAPFDPGSLVTRNPSTLREILGLLQSTYCRSIGAEYMHLNDTRQKRWIQQQLEGSGGGEQTTAPVRRHLLEQLVAATGLEEFLHTKYVGQKRFSLEGGEGLIPMLDALVQDSGAQGAKELVIGMAHRGRLNVLVNILGKGPRDLFLEFEGQHDEVAGSGDVKYHLGFSSDVETAGGPVHLALAFNPSHLEIINPVVEGSVRARQERRRDRERDQVLPILIHGDAAISGQGVVMETLNLSQTRGYSTGGTVHIVINNQIGFTTSEPLDSRSTLYCTDVAKMVQAPIFHVNGDDPEAILRVTRLALAYRMRYHKDVVVDLVCYRRHGHSEADEPAVTQPLMYQAIRRHPRVRDHYARRLVEDGVLEADAPEALQQEYLRRLEAGEAVSRAILSDYRTAHAVNWSRYLDGRWDEDISTAVAKTDVSRLLHEITVVPEGFKLHPAVQKVQQARRQMAQERRPLDWGAAELLAYATLLENGYPVRISGQDSGRGTFFHRHAVLHNQVDGERYLPLQHLSEEQPQFLIIDSILSEEAVLGFELGYSAAEPDSLVIWEAQFGDFANNAQVVIDQFISSSAVKWQRHSGLVLMLPHGYDGQGPEHSSARLERFLQLCAEDNMQVCYPSTPAQMFHMLRRQMLRRYRRPMVVMSPKSLLRHKLSTSSLDDLAAGSFQTMIDDPDAPDPGGVRQLLLCSGKVFFDLLEHRRKHELHDTAVVRVEQLYPLPEDRLVALLDRYGQATAIRWVQEEPWNQGAWFYMHPQLKTYLLPHQDLDCATRPPSASPAVGYLHKHIEQQKALVRDAFDFSVVHSKGVEGVQRLRPAAAR